MNRRRGLLLIVAALLVAINAWRWLGASPAMRSRAEAVAMATESASRAADFRLATSATDAPGAEDSGRDLFRWRAAPQAAARPMVLRPVALPSAVQPAPTPDPGPPPKSPQQLAEEAAQTELSQFRLGGVVVRNNRSEAYLLKGEQIHLVRRGDRVGDRFTVEALDTERIVLADPVTHVRGTLQVAGK